MNIDIMDTITLSDKNKYLVVSKVNHQDNTYYYLIDEENNKNIKFCLEEAETKSLTEINDSSLIQILVPLFATTASQYVAINNLEEWYSTKYNVL